MQEEEEEEEEGGGGERRYGYCLRTRGSCTRAPGTPAVVIINCISSSSRPLFAQRLYLIPRRVLMATCHRAADSYRVPPSSFPTGVTLGYPRWGEEGGGGLSLGSRVPRDHSAGRLSRTPGGYAGPCACTLTRPRDVALWQSSPTPAPLNYSRHAVESFTQSFSYINATQRDWSAARSVSRASSRPFRCGRRGRGGPGGRGGVALHRGGGWWGPSVNGSLAEDCGATRGQAGERVARTRRLLYFAARDPLYIVTLLISRYIVMMTI